MLSKRIKISGRVQGVYFRAATRDKALELGIAGLVSNLSDGSVEVIARGSEGQLAALVAWCHEGPPAARVQAVNVYDWEGEVPEGFRIVRGGA